MIIALSRLMWKWELNWQHFELSGFKVEIPEKLNALFNIHHSCGC